MIEAGGKSARRSKGEEGYILVAVMFMLAILILSMAVAVPRIKDDIQRDREVETMHRGKQYARAIKLYYKKFQAYPPNMDALVMTNQIRFLRKKYTDPMTGKNDWKPIMFGQNKAPLAMGFFGQPLGGAAMAGTGPGGGNGIQGASALGSMGGSMNSTFGSNSGGSTFGGSSTFSNGSSSFGGSSSSGSIFGQDNSGQNSGNNTGNGTTSGQSGTGGGTDASGGSGTNSGSLSSTQTYGGGGIIGFEPASDKQSILFFKKKNHYNEWEFTYSPIADQMMSGGNLGTIGTPAGGSTNGTFGGSNQNGFGNSFGNSGSGGTGTNSPTTPTSPTSPQQ